MADLLLPRYPVYVPSKGRAATCLTARCLTRDGVPFSLVVEPGERAAYAEQFGAERILTLPFSNPGSVIPARNWIKAHATATGAARHWQLDDNIRNLWRRYRGQRIYCAAGPALAIAEDFTDRYENVAVAGLNYDMFVTEAKPFPSFSANVHVYSCSLILNALPYCWRGRYNEDTDYCLQVLAGGWCTLLLNAFVIQKLRTMVARGGNTDALYRGDGRLKMARSLERLWPGVVKTTRRFKRPQHVINWQKFATPLRLRAGLDLEALPSVDEYGLTLREVRPVKSAYLRELLASSPRRAEPARES